MSANGRFPNAVNKIKIHNPSPSPKQISNCLNIWNFNSFVFLFFDNNKIYLSFVYLRNDLCLNIENNTNTFQSVVLSHWVPYSHTAPF